MKILIVYYSLTGNTKLIAESIRDALNADILALMPKKELNPDSPSKYILGGMQAKMHKKLRLEPFDINPLDYDLLFIGSPVWAWTFTPPIRRFISQYDFSGKNIAIWLCCAGAPDKALVRLKKKLENVNLHGEITFTDPLKSAPEDSKQRAKQWAQEIVNKVDKSN